VENVGYVAVADVVGAFESCGHCSGTISRNMIGHSPCACDQRNASS